MTLTTKLAIVKMNVPFMNFSLGFISVIVSFVLNSLSQLALIAFFAAAVYNPLKLLKGKNFMYGVVYKITNKLNGRVLGGV